MAEKNVEGTQSSRSQPGRSGAQAEQSSETRQQSAAQQAERQSAGEQQGGRQSAGLQRRPMSAPVLGGLGLSPFSLLRRMLEDMDRMFEGLGTGRGAGTAGLERGPAASLAQVWSPAIDIVERDGRLVVRADLPGMSPDDVRIEVRDDALVLEGERRSEIEVEEEGVYRSERVYGRFSRVIPLPDGADLDKASARFENGVLEIEIPLREDSRRRRIEIQGGSASPGGSKSSGDTAVH
ncbi:MAG TPA: Hsp20/alpha crystallin family protein [Myxococcales bacterium]